MSLQKIKIQSGLFLYATFFLFAAYAESSVSWSGQVLIDNIIRIPFVQIPPGTFLMGSEKAFSDEKPTHQVHIQKTFWMMTTEVTRKQYHAVMKKGAVKNEENLLPITNVTWQEALDFCKKLTAQEQKAGRIPKNYIFTLPSETQWEYACRAGTTHAFAGDLDLMGWYCLNSKTRIKLVGRKQPNAWGLYDMHGNVWEWCLDAWHLNYIGAPVDESVWANRLESKRVIRGGSWKTKGVRCRSSSRSYQENDDASKIIGFRIVLTRKPIFLN